MAIVAEVLKGKLLEQLEDNNELFCVLKSNPYKIGHCSFRDCDNCIFQPKKDSNESCISNQMKWMLSECDNPPVELTKFEYMLLNHISKNTEYNYMCRNSNGALFIFKNKPLRKLNTWEGPFCIYLSLFGNLFKFIKWGDNEPVKIKYLIEHCEVLKDGSNG